MTTVTGSSRARTLLAAVLLCALCITTASAQDQVPELTQRVNDFAGVIDARSRETIDALGSALQRASGDVIVVATVPTFKPYADIREYAVRLFANGGRGIGTRGMDNGLLILLAVDDRQVWIEVGYGLEPIITDGFAGETSRQAMAPEFRRGDYGAGLAAGVARLTERIAQARQVTLQGAPAAARRPAPVGTPGGVILALIVLVLVLNALGRAQRRSRLHSRWGGTSWSGWDSGVGPFRGGWGGGGFGGGGGGGFGGGFGGFGGGRSGGGGGGAGW